MCIISSEKQSKNLAFIVPHTHWDREWRYTLWHNRMRLVKFMDQLIDQLEGDSSFKHFVLDGQCIIAEDYLEMRPERKEQMKNLIRGGRIAVGPWYTLPDLFPINGESVIRNLLVGRAHAEKLGSCLDVGFTTFGWGQTSQMPQIFAGFGIDFIITAKYISPKRMPDCEFRWKAPDGTSIITSRLGKDARSNFFFNTYIPIRFRRKYKSKNYVYSWGKSIVFRNSKTDRRDEDYFTLESDAGYFPDQVHSAVNKSWDNFSNTLVPEARLLLDGSDSTSSQPVLSCIIKDAEKVFDNISFRHATLKEYVNVVKPKLEKHSDLKTISGELRDGPATASSANALSTRIYLKQKNRIAERLLTQLAEPLNTAASLFGYHFPAQFMERAWQFLLMSHAHDSINGVTQDKTADDALHRILQTEEIARYSADDAVAFFISNSDCSLFFDSDASESSVQSDIANSSEPLVQSGPEAYYDPTDAVMLFVWNPMPYHRKACFTCVVDIPAEKNSWDIGLVDSEGRKQPVQIIRREERNAAVDDAEARPWPFRADSYEIVVSAVNLPPMGWKVFRAVVLDTAWKNQIWPPMRRFTSSSIAPSPSEMENEYLQVKVSSNGLLNVYSKVLDRWFTDLLILEDDGDVGDYWVYYPPYEGPSVSSLGLQADICLIRNGTEEAVIEISLSMNVPSEAIFTRNELTSEGERSKETKLMPIRHRIILRRDEQFLRIHTEVDNTVKDHRLRIRFPLGINAEASAAMSHFHMTERSVDPFSRNENADKAEMNAEAFMRQKKQSISENDAYWPEMQMFPMQQCVDLSEDGCGVAILSNDFTEFEVLRDQKKSLALTLFRAVKNRICTEFRSYTWHRDETGGQLQRTLSYDYAFYPHQGDWKEGQVIKTSEEFLSDLEVYQFSPRLGKVSVSYNNAMLEESYKAGQDKELADTEKASDIYTPFAGHTSENIQGFKDDTPMMSTGSGKFTGRSEKEQTVIQEAVRKSFGVEESMLSIDCPWIHLSCFKPAEDGEGYIVRIWNELDKLETCTMKFGALLSEAWYCRMDETLLDCCRIGAKGETVSIQAAAHAIITLRVKFYRSGGFND